MHPIRFIPIMVAAPLLCHLHAEEGAGGHYLPGTNSSFIDALPPEPGFVIANAFTLYKGDAGKDRPLEFGGLIGLNANAECVADTLFFIRVTPLELLGGNYAFAAAIPFVNLEVEAVLVPPVGPATRRSDSASGLGDIVIYPFMLGWAPSPDLKYDVRLGIYAPTGCYEAGQLANTGRNFWTFEPSASVSWLSKKTGTEATLFTGLDFNTENPDTNYKSGTSFHLDGTLAQHFPIGDLGILGIGANGFYYRQISGDSGKGATLGDFKGSTAGVGPVISFTTKVDGHDLAAEIKWLPELDVEKRLKGDTVWFKIGMVF